MKQKDIAQMSINELRERLAEEKGQLVKMKLNHSVSPIESPVRIRNSRRTIARIVTEITNRERTGATN
jgi:large subunit ribosomal protein L29